VGIKTGQTQMNICPDFYWDRVHFPPSSSGVFGLVLEECWQQWCY